MGGARHPVGGSGERFSDLEPPRGIETRLPQKDWLFHIVPPRPRWRPGRRNAPWDAGGRSWRSENDSARRFHLQHISPPAELDETGSKRLEPARHRKWKSQ